MSCGTYGASYRQPNCNLPEKYTQLKIENSNTLLAVVFYERYTTHRRRALVIKPSAAHGRSPDHHALKEHSAWPLLSESIVKAIADEAHKLNRKVTAHVGEQRGVAIALNSGIDVQELLLVQSMQKITLSEVLNAATAKSGDHLNIPLLGSLKKGAPVDIIAVQGDPRKTLKILEYPQLVISGGQTIQNSYN